MPKVIRLAETADTNAIKQLIEVSARKLGGQFYKKTTIEQALKGAFGVDSQLIQDRTYYVVLKQNQFIACGGWSFRKTLFGSDTNNLRNPAKLNPETEAAKIRAFFIHPDYSRQGLGKKLLNICESAAKNHGFKQCQLMATLSGIDFYRKNAYFGDKYIEHSMNKSDKITFLPMQKNL